jgi:hypothetical protein
MMRKRSHILLLVVTVVVAVASAISPLPTIAQEQPAAAPSALPADADLDALLAAQNWNGLVAAFARPRDAESLTRALKWLHKKVDTGAGFMVALLYARNLWIAGNAVNIDDPIHDMRITAGLILLYAYELIMIDGAKCEDQSAPGNRASQLFRFNSATFAFLKKERGDLKPKTVDIAIALEKKTAPSRKDDDLICRGGLEQMKAGLERGAQKEVPNTSGHYRKTVEVTPPADWAPKFVSPDIYVPIQDKARTQMREHLLKLIE